LTVALLNLMSFFSIENLRMADYFLSEPGSTEDLVGERRLLDEEGFDAEDFMERMEEMVRKGRIADLDLDDETDELAAPDSSGMDAYEEEVVDNEDKDRELYLDPNQLAHGEWSDYMVTVDRNIKLWRGGRLESYRALVVGGNLNGCGGFGVGKALDPNVAVDMAARRAKRNIFFVEAYQGNGLTRDLVGKQNSCIVTLRATDNGLRGNVLCREILKRFGITNCVAKSHGNRNPYNVVRATYKALMTHESITDISLKRGKRLVSIDRAMRMQI
jgi:small subunit ribosomal protein S5